VQENPASGLKSPRVSLCPTLPYSCEEVVKILAAIDAYTDQMPITGIENARRMRALILLLRYSGMRIGDAVNLSCDRISGNRLFLYTPKNRRAGQCHSAPFVLAALEVTPKVNETYFFWSSVGNLESAARSWQTRLRRLFQLAKIPNGHAHRFRDTFAVELLLAGAPMERVSVVLGHQSVRITEKHYAPWVRSRQEQLEADLESAWKLDPLVLVETKGTREVHGKREHVN
jgi:integrase/recombinase XerD